MYMCVFSFSFFQQLYHLKFWLSVHTHAHKRALQLSSLALKKKKRGLEKVSEAPENWMKVKKKKKQPNYHKGEKRKQKIAISGNCRSEDL